MEYTEADLPITIHHEDSINLGDGVVVRFETNGEAKEIFTGDSFTPDVEIFPSMEHTFEKDAITYKITAHFEDTVTVEKV